MHRLWLLFVAIVVVVPASAFAIDCYACESVYEARCGEDNFKSESYWKVDCARVAAPRYFTQSEAVAGNASACVKRIYEVDGERRVERSCFFGDVNDTQLGCQPDPAAVGLKQSECLVCDTGDYCNTAPGAWPRTSSSSGSWPFMSVAMAMLLPTLPNVLLKSTAAARRHSTAGR